MYERCPRAEVGDALVADGGRGGRPGTSEPELVVVERLVASRYRHVEGGVAAERERQRNRSGVGHREGLREPVLAERIGHLEPEVIGEGGTRLVGRVEAEGDGGRGRRDDFVVVQAGDAMPLEVNVPLRRGGQVVSEATHDREEHGGAARPPALVALPEVLAAIKAKTHELSAYGVDGCLVSRASDGRQAHCLSSSECLSLRSQGTVVVNKR